MAFHGTKTVVDLSPITRPARMFDFMALDSEGSGAIGDFTIAVCYDKEGAHIFRDREQLPGFMFTKANRDKLIVAANLEYDYATCFQPFSDHYEVTLSNRRWIKAVYRDNSKHAWTAFDIQRVAPLSVSEMGKVIGLPKLSTPPSLVNDPSYNPDPWHCTSHNRAFCIECYCVRDAEITYKFTVMFQDVLHSLGGEMKLTAASTAMNLFRRSFLDEVIPGCYPKHNDLARLCYFGGRVEAFKVGTSFDVNVYDFNSLYPSVMRECEVGLPDTYRRQDAPHNPYSLLDGFGQFVGKLALPGGLVGILPVRNLGRLYFPTGEVNGSWPLSEVRNAIEMGARIVDCKAVIRAGATVKPFSRYIDTLYELRLKYKHENRPDEHVVKILMNSLYGKFAQHDDTGLQKLVMPTGAYDLEEYAMDHPVSIAGREMFLRDVGNPVQSPYIQVHWAAEITARARIRLLDALREDSNRLIYCDTDSVHTQGKRETSTALGALKLEYDLSRVTYFSPKEYGGIKRDGQPIFRAKGIPPAYRERYLADGAVEFKQPLHTFSAYRRHKRIAEWVDVRKSRHNGETNRKYDTPDDYNTVSVQTYPYAGFELPVDAAL